MTHMSNGKAVLVRSLDAMEAAVLDGLGPFTPGADPTRIVVPSEALRRHWVRRIARHRGAVLGVEVCTHKQLIGQILTAGGLAVRPRDAWLDQLARQYAGEEPVLASALGSLEDGYGLVARVVAELLDAGFTHEHASGILSSVQAWPSRPNVQVAAGVAPRVMALIRVAALVEQEAQSLGAASTSISISLAVKCLEEQGARALGSSAMRLVGFADATGRVADLVDALRVHLDAIVFLEVPPDPSHPDAPDPGAAFAEPFRSRFDAHTNGFIGDYGRSPELSLVESGDVYEETAHVAEAVSQEIDSGTLAEDIAVIVRNLDGWGGAIREAFIGRGVPFSGVGATRAGAGEFRRIRAAAEVVRLGPEVGLGRWLEACGHGRNGPYALAIDVVGARTLEELLPRLGVGPIKLPSRQGIGLIDGIPQLRRFVMGEPAVRRMRDQAQACMDLFNDWPEQGPAHAHWTLIETLLGPVLGMGQSSAAVEAVGVLSDQVPVDAELTAKDARRMVYTALERIGEVPLGGNGGGVSVMTAIEARGRTFDCVFLMGLSRGAFPRVVREDPLLPDGARRALRPMLPDLREKRLGLLEERFLFAQILASSPKVQLSFSRLGPTGSRQHPSSLIVELQLNMRLGPAETSVLVHRPPWRVGVDRGLRQAGISEALTVAGGSASLCQLAAAREGLRGVHEPYMGAVGPRVHPGDTRGRPLFVTAVEATARCPWQAFLTRFLGIGSRPDPWGPLPSLNTHLLGRVVHGVVERVVLASCGEDGAGEGNTQPLVWPGEATLRAWILVASEQALKEDGVSWTGFGMAVAAPALAAIEILKSVDENLDGVVGGEVEMAWEREDGKNVGFRADRVGEVGGVVTITDFKLGKPPTVHKREATRITKVEEAVRDGRLLQGMVYARSKPGAQGRYLYLNAEVEMPQREFVFSADDLELNASLDAVMAEVTEVLDTGAFFPRVSECGRDQKPTACTYCAVREACLVEDSSMRRTLMRQVQDKASNPAEQARWALWWRGRGPAV